MIFYNAGLHFFHFLVWIYSFFDAKSKLFVDGRKNSFQKLLAFNNTLKTDEEVYWFHCASLGEFEQARPLIESIKARQPAHKIAISFFSSSGYEIQKNYPTVDLIFYLPKASKLNAQKVLHWLKPTKIFFIKYEFWINYINTAHRNGIPIYLVSALFNKKQIFFQWYGSLFLSVLKKYSKIFVQDQSSFETLKEYHIESLVSGDTRFDRVLMNKSKAQKKPLIEAFAGNKKIVVLGSSWPKEEELIFSAYEVRLNYKIIIAPHNIARIVNIPPSLKSIQYSEATLENISVYEVLIIDNIGMLSSLYSYAQLAFVGGGFRSALHNILEAAVFGIPVLYGYQTQKHPEAEALQEAGGGLIIHDSQQLEYVLRNLFENEIQFNTMGKKAQTFIEENAGATEKILREI